MKKLTLAIAMLAGAQTAFAQDYPTVEFGGRVQADATYFDNDKYDYSDGNEVRRGRVYWRGYVSENWDYRAQIEFTSDDPTIKDGYLRYHGFDNTIISFGHFWPYPGLEILTSSNNATFNERGMANIFQGDRRMGVGITKWSDRYTFQSAVFTNEANNALRGEGVNARIAYRPELGDDQLLHLGLSWGRDSRANDSIRFRARPESHQDSHRLVDTGSITDVDSLNKIGLEAAYVNGRFSAQAEYLQQDVDRYNNAADLSFDGYYGFVSYFLTADSRPYSNSSAAFGTVDPSSDKGAWEIAARVSNLDLTDSLVNGGQADIFTLGVNYYMTRDIRFTANYMMADSDDVAGDDDPNTLSLRVRITW